MNLGALTFKDSLSCILSPFDGDGNGWRCSYKAQLLDWALGPARHQPIGLKHCFSFFPSQIRKQRDLVSCDGVLLLQHEFKAS